MLVDVLHQAKDMPGVKYIRVPRKTSCQVYADGSKFTPGKGVVIRDGSDAVIIASGIMVHEALQAAKALEAEGISVAVIDPITVKPLDEETLLDIGRRFSRIVTIEDGVRQGGMGSAVTEFMEDHGYTPHMTRLGLPDEFVPHGAIDQLYAEVGLDVESIKHAIS